MNYEGIAEGFFLEPAPRAHPRALEAIGAADLICIGPGSIHTSLFAALSTEGMSEAICSSKAKKVFVAHLTDQKGQTENYRLKDYVDEVAAMISEDVFDTVVIDSSRSEESFDERCIVADVAG